MLGVLSLRRVRNTLEPDLGNASEGKRRNTRIAISIQQQVPSVSSFAGSKPSNLKQRSQNERQSEIPLRYRYGRRSSDPTLTEFPQDLRHRLTSRHPRADA